jgi:tight adherence protein C
MTALLLAQAVDFAKFLPFAFFGAFAALAWVALEWMSARKPRAEQRLAELSDPNFRRRKGEDRSRSKRSDAMTKVLEKATPAFAKPLAPKTEKEAGKLKQKLAHAGFRNESTQSIFLGLKLVGLIAGLFLGGGTVIAVTGYSLGSMLKAGFFTIGMFYLPDLVLMLLAKKRKEAIFLSLPDALDLMVVCVEAGLGLDQALRKVSDEMKKSHRIIAEEFGLCNLQMQMGRSRAEVLHELGQRSGVDDLRALASIIIQADKFGSSIAQALRAQSESMRTRRRQIAEEKAAKTAVKLIFPLVMFIFPGIFVVLVGPAAITMVREMFPAMSGGR